MSRTMKPAEAISALAFLSNPEKLVAADENPEVKDTSFLCGIHDTIARKLSRALTEAKINLHSVKAGSSTSSLMDNNSGKKNSTLSSSSLPSTTTKSENSREDNKGVCFGTVEVRKYLITIGMNPSVSSGIPCTLEWDHLEGETEKHNINAYERCRPNEERKHGDDLVLDGITRAKMLMNLGYTKQELLEGIRNVNETKRIRRSFAVQTSQESSTR